MSTEWQNGFEQEWSQERESRVEAGGQYSEVLCLGQPVERREYLRQLAADYLLRDILSFENLKHP